MKKKETKKSSYLTIINDLSEDIGISTEETKSLVDVAISSADLRDINYEQLKQEITTFLIINIFFLSVNYNFYAKPNNIIQWS